MAARRLQQFCATQKNMADRTSNPVASSALTLGVLRAGLHGIFLAVVMRDSFATIGRLPVLLFRPPGAMEYLSWKFYERVITPTGMVTLKAMLLAALLMGMLGWWTSASTKTSALLVILYQGVLSGFGGYSYERMPGILMLVVLAFTPCGDAFSLDGLCGARTKRPVRAYPYPVRPV